MTVKDVNLDFDRESRTGLAEAVFCPTGGLGPNNYRDYLALPNVVCLGGSWMVRRELIEAENWSEISSLARQAMQP